MKDKTKSFIKNNNITSISLGSILTLLICEAGILNAGILTSLKTLLLGV